MARVYAVASAKGGVGKTTTTANLAATLAAADYDVAVVDGDVGMANLGAALGVEATGATLHDVLAGEAAVVDAVYGGPHGLDVVPGDTDLAAFGGADPRRLGRVLGWFDDRDFVFLDTGAGLSHETALPLGLADAVVLVSTPERDALGDTEKTRQLIDRVGGETVGAVLNRAADGDGADLGPLSAPLLGAIPDDPAIAAGVRAGEPITIRDPIGPAAAAYRDVASELADGPVRPPAGARGGEDGSADDDDPEESADGSDDAPRAADATAVPEAEPETTAADDEPTAADDEPAAAGDGDDELTADEPTAADDSATGDEPAAAGDDATPRSTGEVPGPSAGTGEGADGDGTAQADDSDGTAREDDGDAEPTDADDIVVEPDVDPGAGLGGDGADEEDDEEDGGGGFLSRLFGG